MEPRRLFAGVSLNGTELDIIGTTGADTVTLSGSTTISVTFNGVKTNFAAGAITNIYFSGDAGNDVINIASSITKPSTLYGGAGNDDLQGGAGSDTIFGEDGNDRTAGNGGDDWLFGGQGNDSMEGGNGSDTLYGGTAADGADDLKGGTITDTGVDVLDYSDRTNAVTIAIDSNTSNDGEAGEGDYAQYTIEVFKGGSGNDVMSIPSATYASTYAYAFFGNGGNDSLTGGERNDYLDGGEGDDVLTGNAGDDVLIGGNGNDLLVAGAGADSLFGGDGNDTLSALDLLDGVDSLDGGSGLNIILDIDPFDILLNI